MVKFQQPSLDTKGVVDGLAVVCAASELSAQSA